MKPSKSRLLALPRLLVFPFLIALFGSLIYSFSQPNLQAPQMTPEKWRSDLQVLAGQLPKRHVDIYHKMRRQDFESAVASLNQKIPGLQSHQIIVELSRIVAMVGDGHTSLGMDGQKVVEFRYYPVQLYYFDDGIYVVAAPQEYARLVGKRVIEIGNSSIDKAFEAVSAIISRDNDMELRYTAPELLTRPEVLNALGIINDMENAPFVFGGGKKEAAILKPIKESAFSKYKWKPARRLLGESTSLAQAYLFATTLTIEHVRKRENYWFTYLKDAKAVYFQYNRCWDQKDRPTFAAVTEELFKFIKENPVERLIVDLRQNPGGEPKVAEPLIKGIAKQSDWNRRGRVFVLVGRRTFSAALTNALQLRREAKAIVVGEPPRGKPNHPSEGRDFVLPNSGIVVSVSTQFVSRDPALGDAQHLPIDLRIGLSFDEYQSGLDTALDAALNFKEQR